RSRVDGTILALRHYEQPAGVIDEQSLGVVRSIWIAEVVGVVGHRQAVGARVVEIEDPNEAASAVVVTDVADIKPVFVHCDGLHIDRLSAELEAALNFSVKTDAV